MKEVRFTLFVAALFLPLLFSVSESAVIDVPLLPSLIETKAPLSFKDGYMEIDINKRAVIIIKIKGAAEIELDYRSDGYFRLEYITSRSSKFRIDPHFLIGFSVQKGEGRLKINLRHTLGWSPESYPVLFFDGSGKFRVNGIRVTTMINPGQYQKEKNSSFFWRPESLRSSMMNFITPVFWNITDKSLWASLLGVIFVAVILAIKLVAYVSRVNLSNYIPIITLFCMLLFGFHFVVRFIPMVHWQFYLSTNDKIKYYSPRPEYGQLVAKAREFVGPSDSVMVMTENGDWFSRKAICYNLAPVKCAVYDPNWVGSPALFKLIHNQKEYDSAGVNTVIFYNSVHKMYPGLEKVYELNKNVFIAQKK